MVDEVPESPAAREALTGALKESKVDKDPDVLKFAEALTTAVKDLAPDKLHRANIKVGDVDGYPDAIVHGLKATGNVEAGNVTARTGDAVVSDVTAGAPRQKKPVTECGERSPAVSYAVVSVIARACCRQHASR